MDIVKALANESFNKESKTRGVNPIAIGDQHNGLGAIKRVLFRLRS